MYPLCRHLKSDGKYCQSPALHGQLRCFHHQQIKTRVRRASACDFTIPLVYPEDRAALQLNFHLIAQAVVYGRMDTKTAHALTHTYRACMANLRQGPLTAAGRENMVESIILTPEGEEIAPPRMALEDDEDPPAHGQNCPCRKCAEAFRDAKPEEHHADCKCGLCEPNPSSTTDVILSEAQSAQSKDLRFPHPPPTTDVILSEAKDLRFPHQLPNPQTRTARAEKLHDREPAKVGVDKDDADLPAYLKIGSEYEQRYADIVAGLIEPEPPEPLDPNGPMAEAIRSYERSLLEIEENKRIGAEIYRRRFPEAAAAEEAEERRRAGLA